MSFQWESSLQTPRVAPAYLPWEQRIRLLPFPNISEPSDFLQDQLIILCVWGYPDSPDGRWIPCLILCSYSSYTATRYVAYSSLPIRTTCTLSWAMRACVWGVRRNSCGPYTGCLRHMATLTVLVTIFIVDAWSSLIYIIFRLTRGS